MPISLPPLDRRQFLRGTLGGLAASMFVPSLLAEEAASPDCWALMADTHIPGDPARNQKSAGEPASVNSVDHFRAIRADLLSGEAGKPCGTIICGDCVFLTGQPEDYKTLLEEVKPIREAGKQVHFVMGNHDNRKAFLNAAAQADAADTPQEIPDRLHSVLETPKANLFLLDSLEFTNKTPGLMGEKQLQWLADELDARKDKPAILFAHHYPDYTGGVAKNTKSALKDTDEFFAVITGRPQVKAYIYGHAHLWKQLRKSGIHMINLPTTAWRFDVTQPFAWVLATLKDDGMALTLRSLDPKHPKHNEKIELAWR